VTLLTDESFIYLYDKDKLKGGIYMYFTEVDKPAHVVTIFPQASDLFTKLQIDFCCGGDISLKEQIEQNRLEKDEVLALLNERYEQWKNEGNEPDNWHIAPLDELIDYIVHYHHAYIKEELEPLGEFVNRIYRVHGEDQPHLRELRNIYFTLKHEMETHTETEEQEVFPLIKEYVATRDKTLLPKIHEANGDLESEHDETGNLLKQIRQITNNFQLPPTACVTYEMTYRRLAQLEANTFDHIHLENNILFKRL